jgi:hypothetical protein
MRGTAAPFKHPKQKGAHPFLATLWCMFWLGAAPKKWSLFKQHFSNENMCLGNKQEFFSLFAALKRGWGRKCVFSRIYEIKG